MGGNDAVPSKALSDKQLDILNDHYKDTFTRLRETEQARDRLFLWLIGLFVLLILEIGYPIAVSGTLGKMKVAEVELNLQALPLAALLNVTWILALITGLQYCQATVRVNRQYPYLHALEDAISPVVGGADLFQREGKVYRREYPLLLDVAWFAYSILFPSIVICAAVWLLASEWSGLPYPLLHRLVDAVSALVLVSVFFIYRVQPALFVTWTSWQQGRQRIDEPPRPEPGSPCVEPQTVDGDR